MARTSVGLDIGTRAVRLAEVQLASGKPTLTRFGRILLPLGAVDHGEVHDPDAVASAVQTLWKRLGMSGRAVHIGLSNRRVVVRVVELPVMAKDDLASAIRYQAQEHIPIPLDEAVMDFEVLEEMENAEGERFQRVLVVAAERGTVSQLLAAVKAANLEPATLELNAYPLVRCFGTGSTDAEAIVDIGAGVTNVVVHHSGKIRFTRILPTFGGDEFTSAIAQSLGVPRDEAETLKREASSSLSDGARASAPATVGASLTATGVATFEATGTYGPSTSIEGDETDEEPPLPARPARPRPAVRRFAPESAPESSEGPSQATRAATVIEPMLDRFVTEVRGSLDFYGTQTGAPAIDRVVLTGGGSLMGGIARRLNASLGIAVEPGKPFDRVPIGSVEVTPEEREVAQPFIGVAVGLALAGMEK